MSIAKVTEITSSSNKSFEDAIETGIQRANESLKNVTSAWVADQEVSVKDGKIVGYQVRMKITFVLE
ncbi:dodecin family protein [Leucothrix mucor]|uniref:dodecin family protein n=1 Tax=Leucothrix mucor TaxID=45248 RepID=UPI0003B682E8|nr:dodecin family protein [Leucothrix mucor]